ncbi:MAG: ribosome maturation factor RimM [Spirochaetia bacterium]|jgi:16S rRNA processing protein RimM|nr:ribosome maturation factor RimM [Spirochaetia bacterium]
MDDIAIGKIRTSHGVNGFVKVLSFSGQTDHFLNLKEFVLKKDGKVKVLAVESIKASGSTVFVKLKGIDSPEVGKTYAGWEIWVAEEFAAVLGDDEYYLKDLNDCQIVNSGNVLGKIIGISENSINDLLEVRTETGIYIIPFKNEYIGEVNIELNTVELTALWLLD